MFDSSGVFLQASGHTVQSYCCPFICCRCAHLYNGSLFFVFSSIQKVLPGLRNGLQRRKTSSLPTGL